MKKMPWQIKTLITFLSIFTLLAFLIALFALMPSEPIINEQAILSGTNPETYPHVYEDTFSIWEIIPFILGSTALFFIIKGNRIKRNIALVTIICFTGFAGYLSFLSWAIAGLPAFVPLFFVSFFFFSIYSIFNRNVQSYSSGR